jgi:hypothetical protein
MPQLDLLIFKYENLSFMISFFLFFFLNQYLVFPSILRNIVLRRKLITRNFNTDKDVYFSLVFLKKFNNFHFENVIFSSSVKFLRNVFFEIYKRVVTSFNFFMELKSKIYFEFLREYRLKSIAVVWTNLCITKEIDLILI